MITPRRPHHRRTALALAVLLGVVPVAACGGPDTGTEDASGGRVTASPSMSEPTATAVATTTPPSPSPTPPRPVTLAFAGDVHFAGRLESGLEDPAQALASLEPHLSAADVTVVNLETAITERGRPEPKTFHFRAPASALDALDAAGVDVVTMANNHGVDYGRQGLEDSLAAKAESPIPVVGIGHDADEAFAPAVIDVRGTRVAVIGATQVPDHTAAAWPARDGRAGVAVALDPDRLVAAVKAARKSADV
ncbi:MAG TPA: CapA family protein, partial [Actinomycetales bacterium]|nr:CapA family protein [Actinomycetales bacterium]